LKAPKKGGEKRALFWGKKDYERQTLKKEILYNLSVFSIVTAY
jgi:hypothetical protein